MTDDRIPPLRAIMARRAELLREVRDVIAADDAARLAELERRVGALEAKVARRDGDD